MLVVPLIVTPAQTVNVVLGDQSCTIDVYQKFWGLFCDVLVDDVVIIQGVLCQDRNYIVRSLYLGFSGDLLFVDTQGTTDPEFEQLGSRFLLVYQSSDELPAGYGLSS